MNLTNYHSRTLYCDDRTSMGDFIRFAISQGFTSYGISSHAPLPFPTHWTMEWDRTNDYLAEFARIKKKYVSEVELAIGLEIDYLNEDSNPAVPRFRELSLDHCIGSVHLLYNDWEEVVDTNVCAEVFRDIVDQHFNGDLDRVIRLYYERLLRMIELGEFDILGHTDKMHHNAACYRPDLLDEPWYDDLMHDYLSAATAKGYIVEINTKALHHLGAFFPNERYFPLLRELGVHVQMNSDSHYPERISSGRPEALEALRKVRFETMTEWHGGEWVGVSL